MNIYERIRSYESLIKKEFQKRILIHINICHYEPETIRIIILLPTFKLI